MNNEFVNLTTDNLDNEHYAVLSEAKRPIKVLKLSVNGFQNDLKKAMSLEN